MKVLRNTKIQIIFKIQFHSRSLLTYVMSTSRFADRVTCYISAPVLAGNTFITQ